MLGRRELWLRCAFWSSMARIRSSRGSLPPMGLLRLVDGPPRPVHARIRNSRQAEGVWPWRRVDSWSEDAGRELDVGCVPAGDAGPFG